MEVDIVSVSSKYLNSGVRGGRGRGSKLIIIKINIIGGSRQAPKGAWEVHFKPFVTGLNQWRMGKTSIMTSAVPDAVRTAILNNSTVRSHMCG